MIKILRKAAQWDEYYYGIYNLEKLFTLKVNSPN